MIKKASKVDLARFFDHRGILSRQIMRSVPACSCPEDQERQDCNAQQECQRLCCLRSSQWERWQPAWEFS
jgi:hypothetical protein